MTLDSIGHFQVMVLLIAHQFRTNVECLPEQPMCMNPVLGLCSEHSDARQLRTKEA